MNGSWLQAVGAYIDKEKNDRKFLEPKPEKEMRLNPESQFKLIQVSTLIALGYLYA